VTLTEKKTLIGPGTARRAASYREEGGKIPKRKRGIAFKDLSILEGGRGS